MPRATPRQISSGCRLCSFAPVPVATPSFASRALLINSHNVRIMRTRPSGARWTASASPAADPSSAVKATPTVNVPRDMTDPNRLAKVVEETRDKFLSSDGIPAKQLTTAALQTCLKAAEALQPQIRRAEAQTTTRTSSSRLMSLKNSTSVSQTGIDPQLRDSVSRISLAAYTIISHPNVEITRDLLEIYVVTQASLGRPESLPAVLDMFAAKPKPVSRNGQIQYVPQRPNRAVSAIEEDTAGLALQTAIDAKNLDSALGIVEASFGLPAFKKQKLLKHGTAPGIALAALPFGVFGLASAYASYWQNTMDISTATGIGVAGISGYLFVTGSLGLIAKLSHKDQMKRVTWAPGTPLRYRWLREEERAAMDKIALAWGFKEPWRHGEETGPEWEALREYMGYRQMILDRVEFMDGMS